MTISQAVGDALDETIHALARLDLDALTAIEERMMVLAQSRLIADGAVMGSILAKKRVLEQVLNHSESNLDALQRLYRRNMRDLWEH
jgi:hypothetical protein